MINPFNQNHGIIMYNSDNHPNCCMCIPTRYGVPLLLTTWIAVSLFFASFSFMNKSPFFSYFSTPATIVFGVINLLFVLLLLYGYSLHLWYRSPNRYRQYAKVFACFVSAILIDMFINCILFTIKKDDFFHWCSTRSTTYAIDEFQKNTTMQLDPQAISALEFNCTKLHDTEAKLSFMFLIFFTMVFGFWASHIVKDSKNFVMIRPEMSIHPPRSAKLNRMLPTHFDATNASSVVLSNIPPPPPSALKHKDTSIILM